MEDAIALGAVRRLAVDLANMTAQLAIAQAGIEHLQQTAQMVRSDSWDKVMGEDDAGHPEMHLTLKGDQVDDLMRLLAVVGSLG